uniref:Uncharacterized protein n=1 Tax=Salix viminalis TaxID=40686 RepID=A0A6N2MA45_SALVM
MGIWLKLMLGRDAPIVEIQESKHRQVALIKCLKAEIQSGEGVDTVISELAVKLTVVPSVGNQYGKDTGACNPSADSIEMDSSNPSTNQTCTCKKEVSQTVDEVLRIKDILYNSQDEKMPSRGISIRAMESIRHGVIEMQWNEVLEETEKSKAFFQIYEGAVCIHQGKDYMVKELDISEKIALCYLANLLIWWTEMSYRRLFRCTSAWSSSRCGAFSHTVDVDAAVAG